MRVKPILFNTGMVQAILEERKTATRRIIKPQPGKGQDHKLGTCIDGDRCNVGKFAFGTSAQGGRILYVKPPCLPGDILYAREKWNFAYNLDDSDHVMEGTGRYVYYADDPMPFSHWVDPDTGEHKEHMPWCPSIHMPKDAARIWLRVRSVKAERLQGMTMDDFLSEGVVIRPEAFNDPENAYMQARDEFIRIWDSTLSGGQQDLYGWEADPWVWEIEFERCGKPEEQHVPSDNP